MSKLNQDFGFSQKLIALAILACLNQAYAADADDAVVQLTKPTSSVSVGAGAVSGNNKDRSIFGQYNGMRDDSAFGLLDFNYVKLDDATASWTVVEGRNLGLDTREVRALEERQGNWRIYGEYSELRRDYPRTINTNLQGAGTTTPTVSLLTTRGTGSDLDLKTDRKAVTVGGQKWITSNLLFDATFKSEDKDGTRIFGKGFTCPSAAAPVPVCPTLASGASQWALLMLPEPIKSTTRQFDAKLTFANDRLTVSAGYYGSFYNNENGSIRPTVSGNLNNPLGNPMGSNGDVPLTPGLRGILQLPIALPPDNQSHQFYVSGTYGFTPTTRATFKVAYTHSTQEDFFGTLPGGRSNLGGELNTTLAQVGLTARPFSKLSLSANARYEDRDDKTPIDFYNVFGTTKFTNTPIPLTKVSGKLEASYALPHNYRLTVGGDYLSVDRGKFFSPEQSAALSGLRQRTEETGYRIELRRAMSANLSGAISYSNSRRDGSDWYRPNTGVEVSESTIFNRIGIFPVTLEDRTREKLKASADWSPTDKLSLQFSVEDGKDYYHGPTEKGLKDSAFELYGIDAAYALTETWKLTAYYSYSEQTLHVSDPTAYVAEVEDRNTAAGLKITGKASARLDVGADLAYVNDRNRYAQTLDPLFANFFPANGALLAQTGGLPDVAFRQLTLKLFGKYALAKNSDIRLDLVHQRSRFNEWTWGFNGVPFAYSDNTTVSINPNQNVTFLGATYIYKWQ